MDTDIITQLISNLGFPIACVIAMFFMWNKERADHKEESEKWMEAINNNTIVMREISARLESLTSGSKGN